MEFVIAIVLVAAGVVTRNICQNARASLDPVGMGREVPLRQREGYLGSIVREID